MRPSGTAADYVVVPRKLVMALPGPLADKVSFAEAACFGIPVLSCEAPCIRGEIARLAANMVAVEEPFARGCHGETFAVPNSAMARWVEQSDKVVMIDGCFLECHGRILKNLIDEEKIFHVDALKIHKKYSTIFETGLVPESERKEVARQVADNILAQLKDEIRWPEIVA